MSSNLLDVYFVSVSYHLCLCSFRLNNNMTFNSPKRVNNNNRNYKISAFLNYLNMANNFGTSNGEENNENGTQFSPKPEDNRDLTIRILPVSELW